VVIVHGLPVNGTADLADAAIAAQIDFDVVPGPWLVTRPFSGPAVLFSKRPHDPESGDEAQELHALGDIVTGLDKGSVLVMEIEPELEIAHWGEAMTANAARVGLAAAVIDGCVRDVDMITQTEFPVCYRGTSPVPPRGVPYAAWTIRAVDYLKIRGVELAGGDIVAGDADGLVVLRCEDVQQLRSGLALVERKERGIRERFGLPPHCTS
jgi:regulator of RNase E activity RraA